NNTFTRFTSFYADEREQYFTNSLNAELYGDRLFSLAFAIAAGISVTDSFSIGLGSALSLRANALAPVYVADASRLTDLLLNMDAKVHAGLAAHGDFSYRPTPRLHLTGTLLSP